MKPANILFTRIKVTSEKKIKLAPNFFLQST